MPSKQVHAISTKQLIDAYQRQSRRHFSAICLISEGHFNFLTNCRRSWDNYRLTFLIVGGITKKKNRVFFAWSSFYFLCVSVSVSQPQFISWPLSPVIAVYSSVMWLCKFIGK